MDNEKVAQKVPSSIPVDGIFHKFSILINLTPKTKNSPILDQIFKKMQINISLNLSIIFLFF